MSENDMKMTRRTFLTVGSSLAALAAAGSLGIVGSAFGGVQPAFAEDFAADGDSMHEGESIVWSQCNVDCGGRCVFRWHVKDGRIVFLQTDNTDDPEGVQARACLRGRSMRRWVNSPDRLTYPMKRVGARGEGRFERISWDEALDTIVAKTQEIIGRYGNEAILLSYSSAIYGTGNATAPRLFNLIGGYLGSYGDYSTACMQGAMPYLYGEEFTPYDNVFASSMSEAANADLILMFGNSPGETRMGGANIVDDFRRVREKGVEIIHIDPRLNETASGTKDAWLPLLTGTDAALCAAIAHELIKDDAVDLDFLHRYCVGYDEETMPPAARGKQLSYRDYVMGTGYDHVEKTPAWASGITGIPASTIRMVVDKIEKAKHLFVVQGWGPQRHSNGESATRAICMLAILTGQIGLPGTNTGMREAEPGSPIEDIPDGENPVKASISAFSWLDAVDHGSQMTALNAGVQGVDQLKTDVKMIWNFAGNCLTNQHGDINKAHDILVDEDKLEFIVVTDTLLTDSAKYADILLPDAMRAEQLNMSSNGYAEYYWGVCVGGPAQEPPGECRRSYDVNAELAKRFGVGAAFTEGRTVDEWIEKLYQDAASADKELPSWDDIREQGYYKRPLPPAVGLEDFRRDPQAHSLSTPSGKIEIYSQALAEVAATWTLEDGDVISPIPSFDPGREGFGSTTDKYPLLCQGFHFKGRVHSSYGAVEVLKQACRSQFWINALDAQERGIENGDVCRLTSPRGAMLLEARVGSRIIPGVVAVPTGGWHDADMAGDREDKGGCLNTLCMAHPTPLAKGNPSHSCIAQVEKA